MCVDVRLALTHTLCQALPQHQREDVAACNSQGSPSAVEGTLMGLCKPCLSATHRAMKGM